MTCNALALIYGGLIVYLLGACTALLFVRYANRKDIDAQQAP